MTSLPSSVSSDHVRAPAQPRSYHARAHVSRDAKNPAAAVICSIVFAGLGQLYNGQVGKGLALFVGLPTIAFGWLFGMTYSVIESDNIDQFSLFRGLILLKVLVGLIWIWNVYDAYSTATAINHARARMQRRGQGSGRRGAGRNRRRMARRR